MREKTRGLVFYPRHSIIGPAVKTCTGDFSSDTVEQLGG